MSKKFIAKLLIFCMIFTMLPVAAFGAEITPADNSGYTVNSDTATLNLNAATSAEFTITNIVYKADNDTTVTGEVIALENLATGVAEVTATAAGTTVTVEAPATTAAQAVTVTADVTATFGDDTVKLTGIQIGKVNITKTEELIPIDTIVIALVTANLTTDSALPQATTTTEGVDLTTIWKNAAGETVAAFAEAGEYTAFITVTAQATHELIAETSCTVNGEEVEVTVEKTQFTVTKKAQVAAAVPTKEYDITVNTATTGAGSAVALVNGVEATKAKAGDKVTIVITPAEGFEIVAVTNNDVAVEATDNQYAFVMPADNVAIMVTFAPAQFEEEVTLAVDKDAVEVEVDANAEVTVDVTPANATVTVVSGDIAIAEAKYVDGIVTIYGVKVGETTVTVKAGNVAKTIAVTVTEKVVISDTIAPAEVAVEEPNTEGMSEQAVDVVNDVYDTLDANKEDAAVIGAEAAVNAVVSESEETGLKVNGKTISNEAIQAAEDVLVAKGLEADELETVVVPRLSIAIAEPAINDEGEVTALAFDIKLYADVKLTADKENMTADNTAIVQADIELKQTAKPITIELPLPEEYLAAATYVRHIKAANQIYWYRTAINMAKGTISFENPNGFSEFEVMLNGGPDIIVNNVAVDKTVAEAFGALKSGDVVELAKALTAAVKVNLTTGSITVRFANNADAVASAGFVGAANANTNVTYKITGDTAVFIFATENGGYTGGGASTGNISIATNKVGGKVTVTPTRPTRGQTVTINVTANDGYKLDSLVVTDNKGNNVELTKVSDTKYTFVMPAGKVTITPEFVKTDAQEETKDPAAAKRFSDVSADAWYAEYITYVTENALMNGYEDGRFGPNDQTTRAQIVTVLYRLEGEPATRSSNSFSDVSAGGQYYSSAVAWAAINNIVNGYEDGRFGPNDNVTREQIATILYRYASYKDYNTENAGSIADFSDAAKVSGWANTAISWAVGEGLMNGDNGALRPQGNATRAEIAALLMRFCENIAK